MNPRAAVLAVETRAVEQVGLVRRPRRKFTREGGYLEEDLVQYGVDHLACADVLFKTDPRCFDSAGYLTSIGFELLLKAILLRFSGAFPDDHDLGRLHHQVREAYPDFALRPEEEDLLRRVGRLATLRYPNRSEPDEVGDEDWDATRDLAETLVEQLPEDLRDAVRARDITQKGGRFLGWKPA
ncbi:MAG: hypothetical protein DHS20C21_01260 [Gemmatimonadota bacterium]|nr:MAG: hypothetical protein DHS20C21_01260 [Gemmatimonadota bacterium]